GEFRIAVPGDRRQGVPDGRVIMGIRPEAFEDPAFGEAGLPQIEVKVQVIEELGADAHIFFEVDAEPVIIEQARTNDEDEDATLLICRDRALFTARVDPRTSAR